jgi:hypothetical protein
MHDSPWGYVSFLLRQGSFASAIFIMLWGVSLIAGLLLHAMFLIQLWRWRDAGGRIASTFGRAVDRVNSSERIDG